MSGKFVDFAAADLAPAEVWFRESRHQREQVARLGNLNFRLAAALKRLAAQAHGADDDGALREADAVLAEWSGAACST